jgi:mono/diheme cytochrome c family protein
MHFINLSRKHILALHLKTIQILFFLTLSIGISKAYGQQSLLDYGKQDFDKHCSSCHGQNGEGGGWLSNFLTQEPPNLTLLAKQNGGILPFDRLYSSIAGNQIPIHGPSDMPAWGSTFRSEAKEHNLGILYDPDAVAKTRILLLLDYINRLQRK